MESVTPKASTSIASHLVTPNWRKTLTPTAIASPAREQNATPRYITPSSLLEETFTVMSILKEIHMEKYMALFVREEIDLYVFLSLNYNDLAELGIDEADRSILLNAVHCYTEFFGNPMKFY